MNRTLELVRAILRKCVNDWEWLDRAPKVRMLKEPTRRIRFLSRAEAQRLLSELPEHLAPLAFNLDQNAHPFKPNLAAIRKEARERAPQMTILG